MSGKIHLCGQGSEREVTDLLDQGWPARPEGRHGCQHEEAGLHRSVIGTSFLDGLGRLLARERACPASPSTTQVGVRPQPVAC